MSISYYLIKPDKISLDEIRKTSIDVIDTDNSFVLRLSGGTLHAYTDENNDVDHLKAYGLSDNDPTEVFRVLVKEFNLRFISEYLMREIDFDTSKLTDERLDEYRASLME